jgi:hypothetical protein
MVSPTILTLLLVFTSPDFSVVSCAAVSPAVAVILTAVVSFLGYLLMSLLHGGRSNICGVSLSAGVVIPAFFIVPAVVCFLTCFGATLSIIGTRKKTIDEQIWYLVKKEEYNFRQKYLSAD